MNALHIYIYMYIYRHLFKYIVLTYQLFCSSNAFLRHRRDWRADPYVARPIECLDEHIWIPAFLGWTERVPGFWLMPIKPMTINGKSRLPTNPEMHPQVPSQEVYLLVFRPGSEKPTVYKQFSIAIAHSMGISIAMIDYIPALWPPPSARFPNTEYPFTWVR